MSVIKEVLLLSLLPDEICDYKRIYLLCSKMTESEWIKMLLESGEAAFLLSKFERLGIEISKSVTKNGMDKLYRQQSLVRVYKRMQEIDIEQITDIFDSQGIDYLMYKGIAMEKNLYGNYVDRHIGDIDILVRPMQIAKAAELAVGAGYNSHIAVEKEGSFVYEQIPVEKALDLLVKTKHVALSKRFELELHVSLDAYHVESIDDAFFDYLNNQKAVVCIGKKELSTLDISNTFIYACLHYYNHWTMQHHIKGHFCVQFRYLYEVFEAAYQIDKNALWDEVYSRVRDTSMYWRIGIVLLHMYELTYWNSNVGSELFVTEFVKEHKDDLIADKAVFSEKWRIPIQHRIFKYDYNNDVIKKKTCVIAPL